eukprot:gene14268-21882_t
MDTSLPELGCLIPAPPAAHHALGTLHGLVLPHRQQRPRQCAAAEAGRPGKGKRKDCTPRLTLQQKRQRHAGGVVGAVDEDQRGECATLTTGLYAWSARVQAADEREAARLVAEKENRERELFAVMLAHPGRWGGGGLEHRSPAIVAEVLLNQAKTATSDHTSSLRTAVACYAFDLISPCFLPSHQSLLLSIKRELYSAIFAEPTPICAAPFAAPVASPPPPSLELVLGTQAASAHRYMGSRFHFEKYQEAHFEARRWRALCARLALTSSRVHGVLAKGLVNSLRPFVSTVFRAWKGHVRHKKIAARLAASAQKQDAAVALQREKRVVFLHWRLQVGQAKFSRLSEMDAGLRTQLDFAKGEVAAMCFRSDGHLATIDHLRNELATCSSNLLAEKRKNCTARSIVREDQRASIAQVTADFRNLVVVVKRTLHLFRDLVNQTSLADIPDDRVSPGSLLPALANFPAPGLHTAPSFASAKAAPPCPADDDSCGNTEKDFTCGTPAASTIRGWTRDTDLNLTASVVIDAPTADGEGGVLRRRPEQKEGGGGGLTSRDTEELVLAWARAIVERSGLATAGKKPLSNFGRDWVDGEYYIIVLNHLSPSTCHLYGLQEPVLAKRYELVIKAAVELNLSVTPLASDLARGVSDVNFMLLADLFRLYGSRALARRERRAKDAALAATPPPPRQQQQPPPPPPDDASADGSPAFPGPAFKTPLVESLPHGTRPPPPQQPPGPGEASLAGAEKGASKQPGPRGAGPVEAVAAKPSGPPNAAADACGSSVRLQKNPVHAEPTTGGQGSSHGAKSSDSHLPGVASPGSSSNFADTGGNSVRLHKAPVHPEPTTSDHGLSQGPRRTDHGPKSPDSRQPGAAPPVSSSNSDSADTGAPARPELPTSDHGLSQGPRRTDQGSKSSGSPSNPADSRGGVTAGQHPNATANAATASDHESPAREPGADRPAPAGVPPRPANPPPEGRAQPRGEGRAADSRGGVTAGQHPKATAAASGHESPARQPGADRPSPANPPPEGPAQPRGEESAAAGRGIAAGRGSGASLFAPGPGGAHPAGLPERGASPPLPEGGPPHDGSHPGEGRREQARAFHGADPGDPDAPPPPEGARSPPCSRPAFEQSARGGDEPHATPRQPAADSPVGLGGQGDDGWGGVVGRGLVSSEVLREFEEEEMLRDKEHGPGTGGLAESAGGPGESTLDRAAFLELGDVALLYQECKSWVDSAEKDLSAARQKAAAWSHATREVDKRVVELRVARASGRPVEIVDEREKTKFTKLSKHRLKDIAARYSVSQQQALAPSVVPATFDSMVQTSSSVLLENYQDLKRVFDYYRSLSSTAHAPLPDAAGMHLSKFWKFCSDIKCVDRDLSKAAISQIFTKANAAEGMPVDDASNDLADNPNTELVPAEFAESVVRLADARMPGLPRLEQRVAAFLKEHVVPNAAKADVSRFKSEIYERPIQRVLSRYSSDLSKVFLHYASADKKSAKSNTINFIEFTKLLSDCNLLTPPLDQAAALTIFVAMQDDQFVDDDNDEEEYVFHEFLEALVACTVYRHPCPYVPLDNRLEHFITANVLTFLRPRFKQMGIKFDPELRIVPMAATLVDE